MLLLILLVASVAAVPFLAADTLHQASSEFEVNLIINENKNSFILVGTIEDQTDKRMEKLKGYFEAALNH